MIIDWLGIILPFIGGMCIGWFIAYRRYAKRVVQAVDEFINKCEKAMEDVQNEQEMETSETQDKETQEAETQ
jgi:hypothetical protein